MHREAPRAVLCVAIGIISFVGCDSGRSDDNRKATSQSSLAQLCSALKMYQLDTGGMPPSGNLNLVSALKGVGSGKGPFKGPFFEFGPQSMNERGEVIDAWSRPLIYIREEGAKGDGADFMNSFLLYSCGANGADEKGLGDDVLMP